MGTVSSSDPYFWEVESEVEKGEIVIMDCEEKMESNVAMDDRSLSYQSDRAAAIIFFHNEGRNIQVTLNHARISFVHIFIVRSETHHSFNLTTYKFSLSA